MGRCFTCGAVKDFKSLQAGHFIPGRHPAYLFEPQQVHAQCYHCNVGLKGNWPEYYKEMVKRHGLEVVEKIINEKRVIKQFKVPELIEIYEKYKKPGEEILPDIL